MPIQTTNPSPYAVEDSTGFSPTQRTPRADFFTEMQERTGLNIDVNSWEEISAKELEHLVQVVEQTIPEVTAGMRNLPEDLRVMSLSAQADGCSIAFLFQD